jgi:hypothetical protein
MGVQGPKVRLEAHFLYLASKTSKCRFHLRKEKGYLSVNKTQIKD